MRIMKDQYDRTVLFGKEKTFDKLERKYEDVYLERIMHLPDNRWKMETTVEREEEETRTAVEEGDGLEETS